jgi:NAD(P)-dependent dehydrogenase (short-subunit alcohol dehydrogenase family)
VLRLEEGDRITVTTVYPGYIRTGIHRQSVAAGVPLEGSVPVEDVSDAARTLVRAALGEPARDLATTRQGSIGYAVMRLLPRRALDAITRRQMTRLAKRGHFAAEGLAGEYAARLTE